MNSSAKEPEKAKQEENEEIIDTSSMSEGKRAALELAEASRQATWDHASFAADLFMGKCKFELFHPFPALDEEKENKGAAFLQKLEVFLRENTDPDKIDEDGEIPDEVIEGLAEMGAFGIKISEDYDGLGLSQTTYSKAAILLGSHCGNLTALLSAHQSIGVPQPLKLFGTEAQKKKYLPRVATGEISAFALTEEGVGSDPAKMSTLAEPTPDGSHFMINGEKLWCTNGTRAGLLVVMAKTPDKEIRGKKKSQITAFIVEADSPGIKIEHRCHFMGLRSLYNAVITFKDVKVPRENIILEEGKGLKVALSTLNTGRLTLPAGCTGMAKRCLEVTRKWATEREQWGAKIGHHAAIADKISNMAAHIFAMESMTLLTSGLVDRGNADIRLEAAMCKLFGSEVAWDVVDETMQIRGGRGYETAGSLKARGRDPIAVERFMRDCRINRIFEGSTEIMHLFIAREALDPHLKVGAAVMNSRLPFKERIKAAGGAMKFYAGWYPSTFWPKGLAGKDTLNSRIRRRMKWVERTSRKLARTLFYAMAKHGPKLEREQMLLGRLVLVGTELFAVGASCARAQHLIDKGANPRQILPLVDLYAQIARLKIDGYFRGVKKNADKNSYKMSRKILEGDYGWLEEGIVKKG